MADTKNTIKTTVELDTTQARQEIIKLNSKASDSTKSLEERVAAKNKQVKLQEGLSKQTISSLEREAKEIKRIEGESKNFEKVQKKINAEKIKATRISETNSKAQAKLSDGLAKSRSATHKLDKATGGLLTAMRALAANPLIAAVTLLVGVFTLLRKALSSNEEGQNKLAKIGAVLGSIFDNLVDIIAELAGFLVDVFSNPLESIKKLGKFIKENIVNRFTGLLELIPNLGKAIGLLFSGEFAKAGEVAANAVGKVALGVEDLTGKVDGAITKLKELGAEVASDAERAAKIADQRARADKIERDLIIEKAKAEREIAELRDIAAQKATVSAEERLIAIQKASQINEDITNKEISLAKIRRDALIEENKLSGSDKEAKAAEAQAIAEVIRLESQRLKLQKSLSAELSTTQKEQETLAKKSLASELALEKLRFNDAKKKGEATLQQELDLLEKLKEAKLSNEKLSQEEVDIINEEFRIKREEAQEKQEEIEAAIAQKSYENTLALEQLKFDEAQKRGEATLQQELDLLEKLREAKLANETLTLEEIDLINEEFKIKRAEAQENQKIIDEEKRIADAEVQNEIDLLEIERLATQGQNVLDLELALLERKRQQDVAAAGLTAKQIDLINTDSEAKKDKIRKVSEKAEAAKENAILNNALNGAAEAFGIAQEVAIAKMIMAAPEAISGSFKEAAKAYKPPISILMGALGAAGVVAPIIKGLADIKKVRFTKGGGGGGGQPAGQLVTSAVATGANTVQTPSVASDILSNIGANNSSRAGIDTELGSSASAVAANNIAGSSSNEVVFSESKYNDFQEQVAFKEGKTSI